MSISEVEERAARGVVLADVPAVALPARRVPEMRLPLAEDVDVARELARVAGDRRVAQEDLLVPDHAGARVVLGREVREVDLVRDDAEAEPPADRVSRAAAARDDVLALHP